MDQGGCVETIKPTTHENPTYFVDGIALRRGQHARRGAAHLAALTNATLPYGLRLAKLGWKQACKQHRARRRAVVDGKVVYPGVAEAFGLPLVPVKRCSN